MSLFSDDELIDLFDGKEDPLPLPESVGQREGLSISLEQFLQEILTDTDLISAIRQCIHGEEEYAGVASTINTYFDVPARTLYESVPLRDSDLRQFQPGLFVPRSGNAFFGFVGPEEEILHCDGRAVYTCPIWRSAEPLHLARLMSIAGVRSVKVFSRQESVNPERSLQWILDRSTAQIIVPDLGYFRKAARFGIRQLFVNPQKTTYYLPHVDQLDDG